MGNKSHEEVKKYFRCIARQLHPDKNCHPQAKDAFQKIQGVVNKVLQQNNLRREHSWPPTNSSSKDGWQTTNA